MAQPPPPAPTKPAPSSLSHASDISSDAASSKQREAWLQGGLPSFFFLFLCVILQSGFLMLSLHELRPAVGVSTMALLGAVIFSLASCFALFAVWISRHLVLRERRKLSWFFWGFLVVLTAFSWLYLLLDAKMYRVLGLHLDSAFVLQAFFNQSFQREAQISASNYLFLGALFLLFLLLQSLLLWLCFSLIKRLAGVGGYRGVEIGRRLRIALWLGGIGTPLFWMGLSREIAQTPQLAEALPFFQRLRQQPAASALSPASMTIHYPHPPAEPSIPFREKHDIVFVVGESLRSDTFTPSLMPKLSRLAASKGCLIAKRHHSGGHSTTWGLFSLLYGLHAYHLSFFYRDKIASFPLRWLRKQGYLTHAILSTKLSGWDHGELLLHSFEKTKEIFAKKSHENDLLLLQETKRFLEKPPTRPFFLFLFLNATHHNYLYPPAFERHRPVMPEDYNHFLVDHQLLPFKEKILNRYKNSLGFLDDLTGQIADALEKTGRKTLFVFTGDHGEEFWDHGLLGHGAPNFINARTQVPMMLCAPKPLAPRAPAPALSSHVDIWPSVFSLLAPSKKIPPSAYSNGISWFEHPPPKRHALITSYAFPRHRSRLAWLDEQKKLWLRMSGAFQSFLPFKQTDTEDRPIPPLPKEKLNEISEQLAKEARLFLRFGMLMHDAPPKKISYPKDAQIGSFLRVLGYDLEFSMTPSAPNQPPQRKITLKTHFHVLQPIPQGWRLFFHLESPSSKAFWNADHPLLDGLLPLQAWKKGAYLTDTFTFTPPPAFRKGQPIRMFLGMWEPKQGRQPILDRSSPTTPPQDRWMLFEHSFVN